ncbi:MAG: MBL fold metallo-hydrolase [Gemmatimonadaceae bacterium]
MLVPINGVSGAALVDLEYLGRRERLAALLLETADGLAVVDPGPTVSLGTLLDAVQLVAGSSPHALRYALLTHIHLDHAGAAGKLAARDHSLTIYVHQIGAPHLGDPTRLLASATRLYGDRMARLWGEVRPCPADRVRVVRDGERLTLGGRAIDVAYTPGHAIHHAAYLDVSTGFAYVGDAAGERFPGGTAIIPTTPPPDIDLEAWRASSEKLRAWRPSALVLSHFGLFHDSLAHLDAHDAVLAEWASQVRRSLAEPGPDEERAARFAEERLAALRAAATSEAAARIHLEQIRDCWLGLARYWRRQR